MTDQEREKKDEARRKERAQLRRSLRKTLRLLNEQVHCPDTRAFKVLRGR